MSTQFKNIKDVFNYHITRPIDRSFVRDVLTFGSAFVRKNESSINFFGGGYVGVYTIYWTTMDTMTWIEDILEIDDYEQLIKDIHNLPAINKTFKVSGSALNLSFLYIAHMALVSTVLSPNEKEALSREAVNIMQYKFISSLHNHRWPHGANIDVATAVYEALEYKFQLKKVGTWKGLVDARTIDELSTDKLHGDRFRSFDNDLEIVRMINDIWNGLKSALNILKSRFNLIHEANVRILSKDKFTEVGGEVIIKDSVNKWASIIEGMHNIIPDRKDFINDHIAAVVPTTNKLYLMDTLTYISENYSFAKKGKINLPDLVEDILRFVFNIIKKEKIAVNDIGTIAFKLRGIIRSSQLNSAEYASIKDRLSVVIEAVDPSISSVNLSATRISVVLYIAIRALVKK